MSIKSLSDQKLKQIKKSKKKIVLCHGVFDLFHVGHLNHINEAKKFGNILINKRLTILDMVDTVIKLGMYFT